MPIHNPPHPGGILKRQYLEPLGLTVTATARALGVSRKQMSHLLNERAGISPDMALRQFGQGGSLWIGLNGSAKGGSCRGRTHPTGATLKPRQMVFRLLRTPNLPWR